MSAWLKRGQANVTNFATQNWPYQAMTQKFPFEQFLKWEDEKTAPLNSPATKPSATPASAQGTTPSDTSITESHEELRLLGHEITEALRGIVPPQAFNTYFSDTFSVSAMSATSIEFLVTTNFIKKIIEGQYLSAVKKAVLDTLGRSYEVEFKTFGVRTTSLSPNLDNILKSPKKPGVKENTFVLSDLVHTAEDKQAAVNSRVMDQMDTRTEHANIDPNKKFTNFVVGPANNLAHASALAVARDPGQIYPSLYIYGNSGLGKTHLIHAIANHIQEHRPTAKVMITTGNALMVELVEAMVAQRGGGDFKDFKKKYTQSVDVLIIDDIHGLKGKEGTQEQFFHIFNELMNRKKQLIFTSDKLPREIDRLEERIRTRLSSALVVEMQQPDLETRIAILKAKAQEKDFFLGEDVVNLIAKCVKSSIRDLEGCLLQLKAYYDIMNVDIDLELAREHLKLEDQIENQKLITPETITKAVAQYYRIPLGDIRGKTKTKEIVLARQVAMFLIHQHLRKTLVEIAAFFGKKDHTTPMYSLEVVKKRMKQDQQFAQQLLDIEKSL